MTTGGFRVSGLGIRLLGLGVSSVHASGLKEAGFERRPPHVHSFIVSVVSKGTAC